MKRSLAIAVLLASAPAFADELDIARNALRDGLWEVARIHASNSGSPEAFPIILESHAREGDWDGLLKLLDSATDAKGDEPTYYRALALARTGRPGEAAAILADASFSDDACRARSLVLRSDIARGAGRPGEVVELAADPAFPSDDVDAKMLLAWARNETGDRAGAESLWLSVVDSTNATDAAVASSATELSGTNALRKAYERLADAPSLRRAVGLRLGRVLLADEATFAEGEGMIRLLAKDSPDADGAKDAFLALAEAVLMKGEHQKALDAYQVALDAWPDAAGDSAVQEGRGWALRRLGRVDDSLEAFARAFDSATNDVIRARALMEQGDVLSENSRGEEAMAKYREVLAKFPGTPSGNRLKAVVELRELEERGRSLYGEFRFAEAQRAFEELARRDPSQAPRMSYLETLCLYGQGRDAEAEAKASGLASSCQDASIRAEATLWLAKFAFNSREWARARELFAGYATNLAPESARSPVALSWAARAAFAEHEYAQAVSLVTTLAKAHPDSPAKTVGLLVQGEALIELARLSEAIVVLDKVCSSEDVSREDRRRARTLKSDVLYVMGADNPARYAEALEGYRAILQGERLSPDEKLQLSFKVARTLEKLDRTGEAVDQYYSSVVCAYRDGRRRGVAYDEESMAVFARAAFRLADVFERLGNDRRASRILDLVVRSDVLTAVPEAERRRDRLKKKGIHP